MDNEERTCRPGRRQARFERMGTHAANRRPRGRRGRQRGGICSGAQRRFRLSDGRFGMAGHVMPGAYGRWRLYGHRIGTMLDEPRCDHPEQETGFGTIIDDNARAEIRPTFGTSARRARRFIELLERARASIGAAQKSAQRTHCSIDEASRKMTTALLDAAEVPTAGASASSSVKHLKERRGHGS